MRVWTDDLTEADLNFVLAFVLSSGSLKALAQEYGVSYPTIRARLDRLIEKLGAGDRQSDLFERRLRGMAIDKKIPAELVDDIVAIYREGKSSS